MKTPKTTHSSAKAQVRQRCDSEIEARVPWAKSYTIRIDPACLDLTEEFLNELHDLVDGDLARITFLRISPPAASRQGLAKAFCDVAEPAFKTTALRTVVNDTVAEYNRQYLDVLNRSKPENQLPALTQAPESAQAQADESAPLPVLAAAGETGAFAKKHPWIRKYRVGVPETVASVIEEFLDQIEDIAACSSLSLDNFAIFRISTFPDKAEVFFDIATGIYAVDKAIGRSVDEFKKKADALLLAANTALEWPDQSESSEPCICVITKDVLSKYGVDDSVYEHEKSTAERRKIKAELMKFRDKGKGLHRVLQAPPALEAFDALSELFPNFREVTDFIRSRVAVCNQLKTSFSIPPILLEGEPGIGKTEFTYRLAKLIGTSFVRIDMSSAQSGTRLSGSEAFWSNSQPGVLFSTLVMEEHANPLVFLDEIEKARSADHNPVGPLYGLLEPTSAAQFEDLSFPGVTANASHVIWIAACNNARTIDAAILDRFRLFRVPLPTEEQMPVIAQSIYVRLRENNAWGALVAEQLHDSVMYSLRKVSPRLLARALENACIQTVGRGERNVRPDDILVLDAKTRTGFI